jgi:hypothetical protein
MDEGIGFVLFPVGRAVLVAALHDAAQHLELVTKHGTFNAAAFWWILFVISLFFLGLFWFAMLEQTGFIKKLKERGVSAKAVVVHQYKRYGWAGGAHGARQRTATYLLDCQFTRDGHVTTETIRVSKADLARWPVGSEVTIRYIPDPDASSPAPIIEQEGWDVSSGPGCIIVFALIPLLFFILAVANS